MSDPARIQIRSIEDLRAYVEGFTSGLRDGLAMRRQYQADQHARREKHLEDAKRALSVRRSHDRWT